MNTVRYFDQQEKKAKQLYKALKLLSTPYVQMSNAMDAQKRARWNALKWSDTRTLKLIAKNIHKWLYPSCYILTREGKPVKQKVLELHKSGFAHKSVSFPDKEYFAKYWEDIFEYIADRYYIADTAKEVSQDGNSVYFWISNSIVAVEP